MIKYWMRLLKDKVTKLSRILYKCICSQSLQNKDNSRWLNVYRYFYKYVCLDDATCRIIVKRILNHFNRNESKILHMLYNLFTNSTFVSSNYLNANDQ